MGELLIRESFGKTETLPTELKNSFQVSNSNIWYEGILSDLEFSKEGQIIFSAQLSKYSMELKKKRKSLFSKEFVEEPSWNVIWSLNTSHDYITGNYCHHKYKIEGSPYIKKLREIGFLHSIYLEGSLFPIVFNPLEKKIWDFMND